MKYPKLAFFLLSFIFATSVSCSSDDSSPEVKQPEVVVNPANEKLVSVTYPISEFDIPYTADPEIYEYDDLNRVNKISSGGFVSGVNYVSNDFIEINLLQDPIENFKFESKASIYLEDKNIRTIVSKSFNINEITAQKSALNTDSTIFVYNNKYIYKLQSYRKNNLTANKFVLTEQIDFKETNGNITQVKKTGYYGDITITNYTYDNESYVKMGDMIYETPSYLLKKVIGLGILGNDIVGKKSSNNIIKAEFIYDDNLKNYTLFKTIDLKRKLDKYGRLSEIEMTGTTLANSASNSPVSSFKVKKTSFIYK